MFTRATKHSEEIMTTGLVHGMSQEDYRAADAASASTLKDMGRSPAYARHRLDNPTPSTPAMEFGTACHVAILEPEELSERYDMDPGHPDGGYPKGWRNTKVYKEAKSKILESGKLILSDDEFAQIFHMASNVQEHRIGDAISRAKRGTEISGFAFDDEFGLWRKIRPDLLAEEARMIVDLKTSSEITPGGFARACARYGYHTSAAYYIDTMEMIQPGAYLHYVFLVVSNTAPYEVATYSLDWESIEQGRTEYRRHLEAYAHCRLTKSWPGPNDEIEEIRLPGYALSNTEMY